VSRRRVLEAVFILQEFPYPSRRIFIGSHSLPPSLVRRIGPSPHRLLAGGKAGGDYEQLVGVDRRAAPELAHEVPAGRALEEGVDDLGLGDAQELRTALGEAPYEIP
jgi:hypothetical protein